MGRIIFTTGGARSGKSSFAEAKARELAAGKSMGYIATAMAFDDEMRERIRIHRERRSAEFTTWEEPIEIDRAVGQALGKQPVVMLECITVWLGNVFTQEPSASVDPEAFAMERIARLLEAVKGPGGVLLIVSNEVGLGIVPADALSRRYRDAHGRVNQRLAAAADEAYFVVSGIPMRLK